MNLYLIRIGTRTCARLQFEAMAPDSCTVTEQHLCLALECERVEVTFIREVA